MTRVNRGSRFQLGILRIAGEPPGGDRKRYSVCRFHLEDGLCMCAVIEQFSPSAMGKNWYS
jgi:hypothetical protein